MKSRSLLAVYLGVAWWKKSTAYDIICASVSADKPLNQALVVSVDKATNSDRSTYPLCARIPFITLSLDSILHVPFVVANIPIML